MVSQLTGGGARRGQSNAASGSATTPAGRHIGRALTAGVNTAVLNTVTPAQIDAALAYRPDPQASARMRAENIQRLSAQNPALRPQLEQAFANDAVLRQFDGLLGAHGYSIRNVADAMAGLLWSSWQIVHGATLTDAQIRGVHQQLRAIFLSSPDLRGSPRAARQKAAEGMAYVAVIQAEAMQTSDAAKLAEARRTTVTNIKTAVGVDLSEMEVTADNGFRQRPAAAPLAATAAVSASLNAEHAECINGDRKNIERRIEVCSRVIAGNRGNPGILVDAYRWRGSLYGEMKQFDRMTADYEEVVRLAPQNPAVYVVRADGAIMRRDYDRALADLEKVLATQPNAVVAEAYALRAYAYLRMARYEQALADCNKAISIKPGLSTAYAVRALHDLEQGNNDAVMADIGEAIRLEPQADSFYVIRAEAHVRKGQLTEAQADTDRSLERNPRNAGAHDVRARIALAQGRVQVALSETMLAIHLDDQQPSAFVTRGSVYERGGNTGLALADYRRALDLPPNDKMDRDSQATARQRIAALSTAAAANASAAAAAPAALTAIPPAAPPGRRIALVIGMSAYANVPALRNPARDARAVADAFRRLGFADVIEREDLTRARMEEALKDFGDKAAEADWAVIYYAGHGVEMNGVNYLVPVDARLSRADHVEDETVTLARVLSKAEPARGLRMVILDACRNNPFRLASAGGRTRSVGRGLSPIEPSGGVMVAYAARDGTTADDGDSEHSPFTQALLTHLETPRLDIRIMFSRVRDSVLASTHNAQEPFTYGSLPGQEFYFRQAAQQ